jgi:localization factor PodJL
MRKLFLGGGVLLLAGTVVTTVLFMSTVCACGTVAVQPTLAAAALEDPYGEVRDRKDIGEDHYRMGRYPEAIDYWTGAADKGNTYAAHRLGVEYMDGKPGVVQRDYQKARQYHTQAARQGYSLSMFDLGSMNEYGHGAPPDIAAAAKWYGYSAGYGLAQGQYNYATMLEAGDGVTADAIEALKFYVLAARGGFAGVPFNAAQNKIDQQRATPLETLRARLSKAEVDEAMTRADKFVAATGPLKGE